MNRGCNVFGLSAVRRCPFVRAVADERLDDAISMATRAPDAAEPAVVEWLIAEARRHLEPTP